MAKKKKQTRKYRYRLGLRLLAAAAVVGALALGFVFALKTPRPVVMSDKLQVVAGENFWGDIAAQVGGERVHVTSIISDPNADPHLYESNAQDAAAVAVARLVVVNGLGYDDFMTKLLGTSGGAVRSVVTAAAVAGAGSDANPHLWYNLGYVKKVAAEIEARLATTDPAGAAVYATNLRQFDDSLAPVEAVISRIKTKYAGAPVAYTEPVPAYLLDAAGLTVETPAGFARSIEDGNDPSPADSLAMEKLVTDRAVRVLLYNSQATSPVTQRLLDLARQSGVPVVGVTETLPKNEKNYQSWQLDQATAIFNALGK